MKRHNNWVIYTSSYDRGLEHLLRAWPKVVEAVPDAQLHIFYGWKLFERFYKDNPGMMAWKKRMDKMMEHKGITHHGRVSQSEMKKWMQRCGVWAYPTHFEEISCISAMKAQAYGSVPVCTDYAALETTVQHGIKINGDIYEPEVLEDFTNNLINLLESPELQETFRKPMMKWAKENFSWSKVAKQWDQEFRS